MIIVDSHCHLDDDRFADEDVGDILARAAERGVKVVQTISTTKADFEIIQPMAEKHENLYCSYGIHPHNVEDNVVTYDEIIQNAQRNKVIGIGETGLDYFYDNAPREMQRESFKLHLEAARELNLPVIIHSRDADDDMKEILSEALAKGPLTLLLHCFSSPGLTEFALANGVYVSASGIITFKKAEEVRESFAAFPLDRILVETDAPYLAPIPYRGQRNEPAYTFEVAQKLSEIKGVDMSEIGEKTTANFFKIFSKAKMPA